MTTAPVDRDGHHERQRRRAGRPRRAAWRGAAARPRRPAGPSDRLGVARRPRRAAIAIARRADGHAGHDRRRWPATGPDGRLEGDARERHPAADVDDRRRSAAARPSREPRGPRRRPAARRARPGRRRRGRRARPPSPARRAGTIARLTSGEMTRQPAERRQDDRQRRGLRRQRHAQALGSASAASARRPSRSMPLGQRRRPGDEPGRRERRQLEPGVADERRVGEQQQRGRPAERRGRPARRVPSRARAARRRPSRRPAATDGDAPANATYATIATTVTIDRRRRPSRPATAADRGRDDGDVPAGDRDDVADAGRRERRRDVAIDAVAQADQDPGGQSGLGLGQDARSGPRRRRAGAPRASVPGSSPGRLDVSSVSRRRACPTRRSARGTSPYGRVGPRPDAARRPTTTSPGSIVRVARGASRPAEAGVDPASSVPERRDLLALARRPDRLDDHRPRSAPSGGPSTRPVRPAATSSRRPMTQHAGAERDRTRAAGRAAPDAAAPGATAAGQRRTAPRSQLGPTAAASDGGRDGRPDRQPRAARHISGPSTRSLSFSNVFSPTSLARPQVVDGRERLLPRARR